MKITKRNLIKLIKEQTNDIESTEEAFKIMKQNNALLSLTTKVESILGFPIKFQMAMKNGLIRVYSKNFINNLSKFDKSLFKSIIWDGFGECSVNKVWFQPVVYYVDIEHESGTMAIIWKHLYYDCKLNLWKAG